MRRARLLSCALAAVLTAAVVVSATSAAVPTNPKHFFWAPGRSAGHGQLGVERPDLPRRHDRRRRDRRGEEAGRVPDLLGPQWKAGSRRRYATERLLERDAAELHHRVLRERRRQPVGGCSDAVLPRRPGGNDDCSSSRRRRIANPKRQLKGVWTDPTPVPSDIVTLGLAENLVDDPIAMEAQRASAHFRTTRRDVHRLHAAGDGRHREPVYCGYHTQTTSIDGVGNPYRIQYAFIPFLNMDWPGVGTGGCGQHNVNATSDASATASSTDTASSPATSTPRRSPIPTTSSSHAGRLERRAGQENGDKCAWTNDQNITLGGTSSPCSRSGATKPSTRPATAARAA